MVDKYKREQAADGSWVIHNTETKDTIELGKSEAMKVLADRIISKWNYEERKKNDQD